MNKSVVQLVAAVSLILALAFIAGCHGFSDLSKSCGPCRFIYDYQTLIAGLLALLAAFIASVLVHEQVRVARVQSAVMTRDVLIKRLRTVSLRRRRAAEIVASLTTEFERAIYPDPDGSDIEVHPEWANQADTDVSFAVTKLKNIQTSRGDPAAINSERAKLILVAEELGKCLNLISIAARKPWDDPDLGISQEEQDAAAIRAEAQAKTAEEELPGKITAVKRAGKSLDDAYFKLLEALRTQLRKIDDSILPSDG